MFVCVMCVLHFDAAVRVCCRNIVCIMDNKIQCVDPPHAAAMSIEYTIDIQLTELGFPDLGETPETAGGEAHDRPATAKKKLPASHASSTLSNACKRKTQTANQKAVKANDVDQKAAATEPQSSVSSLKTLTGDNENDNDDSEDSDVSMVGDEEEDEYEEEAIDEGEFDGMAYLT